MRGGEQGDQHVLRVVRILILVHHDIAEAPLIVLQHVLVFLQQAHGVDDDIVKVHRVRFHQHLLIQVVDGGDILAARVVAVLAARLELRGAEELVLGAADLVHNGLVRQDLVVDMELPLALLDHALRVVRIIDREMGGIAEAVRLAPQDPDAGGMKGAGPDLVAGLAQHGDQPLLELVRRLIREGDRKDLPGLRRVHAQHRLDALKNGRIPVQIPAHVARGVRLPDREELPRPVGVAVADQARDAVDQHRRFAAACARKNKQWPVHRGHCLKLHGIKARKIGFDDLFSEGEKRFHGLRSPPCVAQLPSFYHMSPPNTSKF